MGQKGLSFNPGFSLVGVGDRVAFPNDDTVSHNVFSMSRSKKFNLGLYNPGANKKVRVGDIVFTVEMRGDTLASTPTRGTRLK